MKSCLFPIITLGMITCCHAAETPIGGMTVAVSPDGKKLVTAGDTRTLVVIDPSSLEVTARHWIETTVVALRFSKDGNTLVVGDTTPDVHLIDTNTWKTKKKLTKFNSLSISAGGGVFAGTDSAYDGPTVFVNSIADGAEKTRIKLPKGVRIDATGLSPDGTKLAVLTEAKEDPSEKKLGYNDIPKDLKGIEKDEFQQKNDGRVANLMIFDAATGKPVSDTKLWYSTGKATITFQGNNVLIVGYQNVNANVSPDGAVKLFALSNSYNYGIGIPASGKFLLTGGLKVATITTTADLTGKTATISQLPGWPEYFKGFDASDDGTIYGTTTGYRIIKFSSAGAIEKEAPIR